MSKLRKISLITAILTISMLIAVLMLQKPVAVNSEEQLKTLEQNKKVIVKGMVVKERISKNYKTLTLDNAIKIQVNLSTPSLKNKEIQVLGRIDDFIFKKIIADKIIAN